MYTYKIRLKYRLVHYVYFNYKHYIIYTNYSYVTLNLGNICNLQEKSAIFFNSSWFSFSFLCSGTLLHCWPTFGGSVAVSYSLSSTKLMPLSWVFCMSISTGWNDRGLKKTTPFFIIYYNSNAGSVNGWTEW